jgi:alginate O-acetyltransferase complex protein AlgI
MLFNSHAFIFVFLPVVLGGFFLIGARDRRLAAAWLALASVAFYGWWNPRFVLLLAASIGANYLLGNAIAARAGTPSGRRILVAALALDLGVLALFKYANFFVGTLNATGATHVAALDIVLPVGISFFTFTQIAWLVDAWRGRTRGYAFVHYFLFVSYFPHLVAGPILHHGEIIAQLEDPATYRARADAIALGLTLFAIGMAKKVLLADPLGEHADAVFDAARDGARPHLLAAWGGALAYTLQLYFDFSGYSDMAIGISMLFNVRLPLNFDSPYRSASIIEFWLRWHMTLSRFLRNYLYVPLGGNRRGPGRRYVNVMITMLLGGLWHGASWTFVAWGGLHGLYLTVNHAWRGTALRLPRAVGIALTFTAVVLAWVVFRSADFGAALAVLSGMAGLNGTSLPVSASALAASAPGLVQGLGIVFEGSLRGFESVPGSAPHLAAFVALGLAIVGLAPNSQALARYTVDRVSAIALPSPAFALAAGALLAVAIMGLDRVSAFLYYQF